MADGFIVRRGGVATEQALAPTITQVATTETSITFTITNNDAETAIIRHRLDDITDEGVIVELATNATSANITVSDLDDDTTFTVFATANVTGKVKSNVTQLSITTNEIPAPTITLVSKTDTSVTFTLKNNSIETRDVTFGLTTPPTTTTISLASDATSGNQTFSNLDSDTFITIFAQAEGGLIGQLNVTTDETLVFTAATGGTTLEYDSGGKRFKSHTFTSDGNFVVSTVGDNVDDRNKVDYLIIAGGGGGTSGFDGGGGGAGGYHTTNGTSGGDSSAESKVVVTATTFGIVVGAGGAGSTGGWTTNTIGVNGDNSSALGITSTGGGTGAVTAQTGNQAGTSGGSGGGGNRFSSTFGSGTSGQGTNGGNGISNGGGGGGGAGVVGGNSPSSDKGGNGGNGLSNTLRTGSAETRGGGAGGSGSGNNNAGTGGTGGGGNGANSAVTATAGTANTGGGGGGQQSSSANGAAGGSGIVVIRYEIAPSV